MKRSTWIERLLLPPAVAVLNTTWVYLWILWSVRAVPPEVTAAPFSPLLLGLLLLGGFIVTRWALASPPPPADPRLLISLTGLGAVFGAVWITYAFLGPLHILRELADWGDFISPVFLGLVACAFLWLQGIQLGRSPLPQENLEAAFYGGVLALSLLFTVNQLRPLIAPFEAITSALAFFAAGLAGLALVSIENARRAEASVTGTWPGLSRYWLGTVASVIGSILLTALLAASVLSPQTFDRVAAAVNWLVDAVTVVVIVMAGTIAFVLAWLLTPVLQYLAQAIGEVNFHLPTLPTLPPLQQATRQSLEFFTRYPALNIARRGLVLGVMVVVLALLFWWAVRRFTRRARHDVDETRESIATRALLLAQLKSLLPRRRTKTSPDAAFLALSGASDDPRLIVRRAYQAMLAWASGLSLPARRAGETPTAYSEILRQALPEGAPAFEILTGAYVQARYAAEAPSMDVARAALGAINHLRSLSAELKRTS